MKRKYFSLEKSNQTATINIYGDICSWAWEELGETSAVTLSKQLEALGDVEQIDVYINSYGGEVAEGLAIYNALRRHKAKIRTFCDGFACSIASVIFMAGDERIMNEASLLMIHNAWTFASGNAAELRKQADDLEKITQASVEAYKAHSSLKEEEIKALMDKETWILPEEAVSYGFATSIAKAENASANQSALLQLFKIVKAYQENENNAEEPENTPDDPEPDEPGGAEPEDDTEDDNSEGEGTDNEPETTSDDTDDENENPKNDPEDNTENAAQKWSGFFNAILKI